MRREIPAIAALAERDRWVCWGWRERDGKPTKAPLRPGGGFAKANDPATWSSFDVCLAASAKSGVDGVGYVLGEGVVGVDLDNAIDPATDALRPWAQKIVDGLDSYTERSPSGTGVKIFLYADPSVIGRKVRTIEKTHGGKDQQVEIYGGGRYFVVTGEHWPGTPNTLERREEEFAALAEWIGGGGCSAKRPAPPPADPPARFFELLERDHALRGAWERGEKLGGGEDRSASGLEFSLARRLTPEFDDAELGAILRAFPHGQLHRKSGADAERRLASILSAVRNPDGDRAHEPPPARREDGKPTQDQIAQAFADRHVDELRYCNDRGAWLVWDGARWAVDETKLAFSWARRQARALGFDGRAATCAGVEKFARADQRLSVRSEIWDAEPMALGTPGGIVDLQAGAMSPPDPARHITKITSVAPAPGDCPIWKAFLEDATQGDAELIDFLQRIAGYALTGLTTEHALFFVYGPGGNGKSVFLNVLTGVMGDYATAAAMDTFHASIGDRHPTDLAMLRGARLVTASETEEGRHWAESRIKQLTGGDPIRARFMRQDFFEYRPQFKLVITGNHKPNLRSVDDAMRRRFHIIPFTHKPANPDPELETKLEAERPQILAWMIEGCLAWRTHGLDPPPVVREATAEYFEEQDLFGQWLEERCKVNRERRGLECASAKLFADWRHWAERLGVAPGSAKAFGGRLRKAGFRSGKVARAKGWFGLTTKFADPREGWDDGYGSRPQAWDR